MARDGSRSPAAAGNVHRPGIRGLVADRDSISVVLDTVRTTRRLAAELGASAHGVYLVRRSGAGAELSLCFDAQFPKVSALTRRLAEPPGLDWIASLGERLLPSGWGFDGGMATDEGPIGIAAPSTLAEPAGLVLPAMASPGIAGLFVFAGAIDMPAPHHLQTLHVRCFALFASIAGLRLEQEIGAGFTEREIACLALAADGWTSEAMASRLGLSVHTANQYMIAVAQKLNAVNRVQAVAKAIRLGLIA